jgi:hypothetical protein
LSETSRIASVLVLFLLAGFAAGQAQPNPVAWWEFDDGAGTRAADSGPDGHYCILIREPYWTSGVIAGALDLDVFDDCADTNDFHPAQHICGGDVGQSGR